MKKAMKILVIITCCIIILSFAGCAVAVFSVGNSVNKAVEKTDSKAADFTAVRSQITMGMTKETVRSIAGNPEDSSTDTSNYMGSSSRTDYWYYGILAKDGWQLVFEDDALTAINRG